MLLVPPALTFALNTKAPPINYSTSFEGGNLPPGWTASGTTTELVYPRTGSYSLVFPGSTNSWAEYVIAAGDAKGLVVAVSVYHRTFSVIGDRAREISYKIGSGSYTQLATATAASMTYAEMSGTVPVDAGDQSLTIRLAVPNTVPNAVIMDDFSISGN